MRKGLILAIAILSLVLFTACDPPLFLTGNTVFDEETTRVTDVSSQDDNSQNKEYSFNITLCQEFISSAIVFENNDYQVYFPTCQDGALIQYFCEGDALKITQTKCEKGCEDGACLEEKQEEDIATPAEKESLQTVEVTCVFEDENKNPREGRCNFEGYSCQGEGSCSLIIPLEEQEVIIKDDCDNQIKIQLSGKTLTFVCQPTFVPQSGGGSTSAPQEESVEEQPILTCEPLNKNQYPEIAESVSIYENAALLSTYADTCLDNSTLQEVSCLDGTITTASFNCTAGCFSGACAVDYCFDSDQGNDSFTAGNLSLFVVEDLVYERSDTCINNTTLQEFICGETSSIYEYIDCAHGCQDGACINPPTLTNITETVTCLFEENSTAEYGTCSFGQDSCFGYANCTLELTRIQDTQLNISDNCNNTNTISFDGINESVLFTCTGTTAGYNCFDTESNINQYTTGSINQTENGMNIFSSADLCLNTTTLQEYYCDGNYYSSMIFDCSGGCSHNSCVVPTTP
ncbi:MAG: hypothetical protein KC535_04885 [Nanoarchaeota archaeon]|nr:hypothetical protein [Nanoarchaeota archaeon]